MLLVTLARRAFTLGFLVALLGLTTGGVATPRRGMAHDPARATSPVAEGTLSPLQARGTDTAFPLETLANPLDGLDDGDERWKGLKPCQAARSGVPPDLFVLPSRSAPPWPLPTTLREPRPSPLRC